MSTLRYETTSSLFSRPVVYEKEHLSPPMGHVAGLVLVVLWALAVRMVGRRLVKRPRACSASRQWLKPLVWSTILLVASVASASPYLLRVFAGEQNECRIIGLYRESVKHAGGVDHRLHRLTYRVDTDSSGGSRLFEVEIDGDHYAELRLAGDIPCVATSLYWPCSALGSGASMSMPLFLVSALFVLLVLLLQVYQRRRAGES